MTTPEQEGQAEIKANMEVMQLEGMRDNLDDPRGYGNCFVDMWKWLKRKLCGKAH